MTQERGRARRRQAAQEQERTPIERVECGLLDAVLALSFEPRELENLLSGAGEPAPDCGCPGARGVISLAHRATHQGGALARRLEGLLDLLHARSLARLEELGPTHFAAETVARDLWAHPDLAGRVWALARCADPAAADLVRYLGRAVGLDALRALAARRDQGGAA